LSSDCITDAENEIRKRLSKAYDVSGWSTYAATPPAVQTICKWLALGYLYEATARGSKEGYARADRYLKKAYSNIDDLLKGNAELVDSSGDVIEISDDAMPILSNTTDYAQTFNVDNQLNWEVDPDKLDDIDDGRD
jgi:hypothetical protein